MELDIYQWIGIIATILLVAIIAFIAFGMSCNKVKQQDIVTDIVFCNNAACSIKNDCYYHCSNHTNGPVHYKQDMMKRVANRGNESYCNNYLPKRKYHE